MAGQLEAIEIKRKMYFEFEDAPYHCLDVEVSKPTARGGQTLVRLKMRNLLTRAVFDRTFKAGEKFKEPDLEMIPATYLYGDSDGYHFMNQANYETLTLGGDTLGRRSAAPVGQPRRPDPDLQQPADRPPASGGRRAHGHHHRAWRARRHRQRGRHQAGDGRDRPGDSRPVVHQGRREGEGPHRDAGVRGSRLTRRICV